MFGLAVLIHLVMKVFALTVLMPDSAGIRRLFP